ncbi:MAG: hypothetical protein PVF08_04365 [Gammaproteobacteria bacterium]|jgi:hypothetical protein
MTAFLAFLAGAGVGFLAHSLAMRVSFKQRTIDNKVRIYDSLIGKWVQIRNFIYSVHPGQPLDDYPAETVHQFDLMYGESQQLIGEAILVCDDYLLTDDINSLNERFYRTRWPQLAMSRVNAEMEEIKADTLILISRMRDDIKSSTRLELQDFTYILSGLWRGRGRS